jgi:hypothetical protein
MPLCRVPFKVQEGPILEMIISKPASMFADSKVIELSKRRVRFLIDTGATRTAISPTLAAEIGLPQMGKTLMKSATQEVEANLFYADLTCDLFDPHFSMPDMVVMEFPFAAGWRDGFLGRDFLSKVFLEISGPEKQITLVV